MPAPPGMGTLPPVYSIEAHKPGPGSPTPRPPSSARASPGARPGSRNLYSARDPREAKKEWCRAEFTEHILRETAAREAYGEVPAGLGNSGKPGATPTQEIILNRGVPDNYGEFDLPRLKNVGIAKKVPLQQDAKLAMKANKAPEQRYGVKNAESAAAYRLLALADEMWKTADAQKTFDWTTSMNIVKQGDRTSAEARSQHLREQLLQIADLLSDGGVERAVTPTAERCLSSSDRSMQSTQPLYSASLAEEVAQLKQELSESQAKLRALQESAADALRSSTPDVAQLKEDVAESRSKVDKLKSGASSVTLAENVRLRREHEDRKTLVSALDKTLAAYRAEQAKARRRDLWLRQNGAQRRIMVYTVGLQAQVWAAWLNEVANVRTYNRLQQSRLLKRQYAAQVRARTLAHTQRKQESLCLSIIWGAWLNIVMDQRASERMLESTKAARKRMLGMLGKKSNLGDENLCSMIFTNWAKEWKETYWQRKARNEAKQLLDEATAECHRIQTLFSKKAMDQMLRRIALSQGGSIEVCFREWVRAFLERKAELAVWEAQAKARAEQVASRAQAVAMAMGTGDKQLVQEAYQVWREAFVASRAIQKSRAQKEHAMRAASRNIMKSQAMLVELSFQGWATIVKNDKMAFLLGNANAQAAIIAAARKRAIALFQKSLNKDTKDLILHFLEGWMEVVKDTKRMAKKKDQIMQRVMRGLGNEAQVLSTMAFTCWRKKAAEDRELNQERGRRRKMMERGRAMVVKLRDKILLRTAFDGWIIRSIV